MPKGTSRILVAMALATAAAGCASTGVDTPAQAAPEEMPSTVLTTTAPTTPPSTTSTTSIYEALGEEVAVSESVLGPVTWRRASSFPLNLIATGDVPSPEHIWTYDWLERYENAREITGACFEIYETGAGYLGLGPCPLEWVPFSRSDDPEWQWSRQWGFLWAGDPRYAVWVWLKEVWFSADGDGWIKTTETFPDTSAVVAAEPWSVAQRDGRWIVIGATGVGEEADPGLIPWDERTYAEKYYGANWLVVPRGADPAAWVSDDLSTWSQVMADFSSDGMDTRLSSVVAGDAGWLIFGVRSSQEPPRVSEWAAWASTDGITWGELSMVGVYDSPCEPSFHEHCGMIKAHFLEDTIFAFAWTWPLKDEFGISPHPGWRLLIGEL